MPPIVSANISGPKAGAAPVLYEKVEPLTSRVNALLRRITQKNLGRLADRLRALHALRRTCGPAPAVSEVRPGRRATALLLCIACEA